MWSRHQGLSNMQSGQSCRTEDQQCLKNDNLFATSGQKSLNAVPNDADGEPIKIYCLIPSQFILPWM